MEAGEGRSFEWTPEGELGFLTLSTPDNELNYFGPDTLDELARAIEKLEAEDSLEVVVLRSGKQDIFSAGADVFIFQVIRSASLAMELSQTLQSVSNAIARSKKKWVAAIDGGCFGGALELALACDYRIATERSETTLAFPEADLGLIPGGGGTQMLPQLIGLRRALDMLITARRLGARKARQWSLVDELATPARFDDAVRKAAGRLATGWQPDRDGTGFERFQLFPGLRDVIITRARHKVKRRTRGNYPSQSAVIDCVETGLVYGKEAGLEMESQRFGRLVVSRECRNLIWLFLASHSLKHHPTPAAVEVEHLGIIGAGSEAAAIAETFLPLGKVTVGGRPAPALAGLRAMVETALERETVVGSISEGEAQEMRERFFVTEDIHALSECDVVIEAIRDTTEVKRDSLRRLLRESSIVGSDSVSVTLATLLEGLPDASRVGGSHFFSRHRHQGLLEVVSHDEVDQEVIDTIVRIGIRQGRSVIFATDTPAFYVTRLMMAMLNEAMLMVEERYDPKEIDESMQEFGFTNGPFRMIDEFGMERVARAIASMTPSFARREGRAAKLPQMMVDAGFFGRQSGAGFYVYSRHRHFARSPVNRRVADLLGISSFRRLPRGEYAERIALSQINEAAWCMREGVVRTATEADVGAVLGVGFPRFRGGPLKHVDTFGAGAFVRRLRRLEKEIGSRFRPCPLLVEMGESKSTFHT